MIGFAFIWLALAVYTVESLRHHQRQSLPGQV
jgi:EamA domain-containing membrane protein RarD